VYGNLQAIVIACDGIMNPVTVKHFLSLQSTSRHLRAPVKRKKKKQQIGDHGLMWVTSYHVQVQWNFCNHADETRSKKTVKRFGLFDFAADKTQ
jgi:hypothetical protein